MGQGPYAYQLIGLAEAELVKLPVSSQPIHSAPLTAPQSPRKRVISNDLWVIEVLRTFLLPSLCPGGDLTQLILPGLPSLLQPGRSGEAQGEVKY